MFASADRVPRLRRLAGAVLATAALVGLSVPVARAESAEAMITQAGNAESDAERLDILKRLHARPGLPQSLKPDVAQAIRGIEKWITSPRLDYFGRDIRRKKGYNFGIRKGSPLQPLASLYCGRMLVWVTMEYGNIWSNADRRREYLDKAVAHFRIAAEAFPNNRIIRMYLGEPIPNPRRYPTDKAAPEWANLQRENLERLADIVEWWIDHRMQQDGQYGGGWGDDCEMWRWWVPVLIAFDEPKITRAQAYFSSAMMRQKHMRGGYTSHMSDVEHTAEDSKDVITPMMHLAPDDPLWKKRALRLAELMEKLWTARNDRGQLMFKSTYFSVDRVDKKPQRACDTSYHLGSVQPALLYWQRTGDKKLGALFSAWMDTWVDATARAERGKPAGIIPAAIHYPDGRIGGTSEDWWDPRNYSEPTLYRWPSAMSMMTNTLLLTWHMTGNEKYLEPLRSMAAVRLRYLKSRPKDPPAPGSEAWCARKMRFLAPTLAKYARLTGSDEFDELLVKDYRAFQSAAGGDRSAVVTGLRQSAEALRVNFEGYTSEVRYTDRVLRFPTLFRKNVMFREAVGDFKKPKPRLLYRTATGDPGDFGFFPLNAVRWLTPPRQIAALVTEVGSAEFGAELFHFGTAPRQMQAELYLLKPGLYDMVIRDGSKTLLRRTITVTGPRTRVRFKLPPRRLCVLRIRRSR